MGRYCNKRTLAVIGVSLGCIVLLWLLGLGFGNETRLSGLTGATLFGSEVYLGTWFIFMMIIPVGFGIPYLVVRFGFHESLRDYGFSLGNVKLGAVLLLALVPLYVFAPLGTAYIGTEHYYTYLTNPEFLQPLHVAVHLLSYVGFAFGFEFLFRGFVLFGLHRGLGETTAAKWVAVGASAVLSALCLIGLPWIFPVSAFLGALLAGYMNLRLGSFFYFAFIHWNLGVWSDVWEIIKLNIAHGRIL